MADKRHAKASRKEGEAAERPSPRCLTAAVLAFGVTWLAMLVRWWPLTRYTLWGSDQGEYGLIFDSYLTHGGRLPPTYTGWGGAYPDFPGMYAVAGTFSQLSGIDPFLVLSVAVPALASLTALVAFLITLHLTDSLRSATLAGAIVATAMPEAFAGSHAMPGALGGLFAFGALAAVVFSAKNPRWRWVALVLTLALVPTHHLSAFLLAAALAGVVIFEARLAPADLARSRIVDTALLTFAASLVLSAAWWAASPHFRTVVLDRSAPGLASNLPWIAVLGVVSLYVLATWLEERPRTAGLCASILDERRTATRLGIAIAVAIAAPVVVGLAGVPGTSIVVPLSATAVFLPLAFVLAAACAGPGRLAPVRGGLVLLGAAVGVLGSMFIGGALLPTVLLPYRHLQYLADFVAPLAAVGLAFGVRALLLYGLPARRKLHRPLSTALLALMILASASVAYPAKEALAGFEEGTLASEIAAITWLSRDVPYTLVASDHRLSSLAFGFGGKDATWEEGGKLLLADSAQLENALNTTRSPAGNRGVTVVLISKDIKAGAALTQWEPARPLSEAALAKFEAPPFVKVFDNGDAVAYWIG